MTIMARMGLFKEIVMPMVMVPVCGFIVLAAALATIMSLERTLGRPIPQLRDSLPVPRNRAFAAVIVCMVVSFFLTLRVISEKVAFWTNAHAWQDLIELAEYSILALAFSGAIGWIVFAALSIASASWRIICRYISN